jgi:hypothetical protein
MLLVGRAARLTLQVLALLAQMQFLLVFLQEL